MNVKMMYLLLRITRIHIVWIGFNRYYENSDGRTCRKIASWNFICYTRSTSIIFLFWRSIYVLGTIQGNFSITIIMTIFFNKAKCWKSTMVILYGGTWHNADFIILPNSQSLYSFWKNSSFTSIVDVTTRGWRRSRTHRFRWEFWEFQVSFRIRNALIYNDRCR